MTEFRPMLGSERDPWWKRALQDTAWSFAACGLLRLSGLTAGMRWWEMLALAMFVYCIARLAANDRIGG